MRLLFIAIILFFIGNELSNISDALDRAFPKPEPTKAASDVDWIDKISCSFGGPCKERAALRPREGER